MQEIRSLSHEFPHARHFQTIGALLQMSCLFRMDITLVADDGHARYGRCVRSLRKVCTLVADGVYARCGRTRRSLRTSVCKTIIPIKGESSYQYLYANSNENNAAKQLWTDMTTSHRTKTDAQPMAQ